MQNFWDLDAWKAAHQLTLMVYRATQKYPREERYGLTRQTRDAVSSAEANIAEGFGRFSKREFRHFCNIACGSLAETQCHLLVARELGFLNHEDWQPRHEQTLSALRPLHGLMRHLGRD